MCPDISMCLGGDCPLKHSCHRYAATPSRYMQSYFSDLPVETDGTCKYYWETKPKEP
jgi:hypothetical protein